MCVCVRVFFFFMLMVSAVSLPSMRETMIAGGNYLGNRANVSAWALLFLILPSLVSVFMLFLLSFFSPEEG